MSDPIKHECGIAFVRLLKPLSYYQEKYGTALYGLQQLHHLMQKQRNRGQDGVGIATVKLHPQPGKRYISRKRSNSLRALSDVFESVYLNFEGLKDDQLEDADWLKANKPYMGELLLGHLRYGTHGGNSLEHVHPFHRQNNYICRNLLLAGNFNLTNVDTLFDELVALGQYPKEKSDTVTILEKIGHFLDDEVMSNLRSLKDEDVPNEQAHAMIAQDLDVARILKRATKKFDGGYVLAGIIGNGDAFILRDPDGIRPAYYYHDDEVVVVASERPAIQSAFSIRFKAMQTLKPGHALIVKHDGTIAETLITQPSDRQKSCSFETIYFSRGNDRTIYQNRKNLGKNLAKVAMDAVNGDFENTVFSFIPNTAEVAFYGFMEGLQVEMNKLKAEKIAQLNGSLSIQKIEEILTLQPRIEKLVHKDDKLRTFIADAKTRSQMVNHVYDVTYGLVQNDKDTLVLIDDSIVRGTTLRDSIVSICARLVPKRIIVMSSAPQIRYPDCYGIDMSKMKDFVAFQALVKLLEEQHKEHLLDEAYERCLAQLQLPDEQVTNQVKPLYDLFTVEQISQKISEIVTPKHLISDIEVIFQTIEGLHQACPDTLGDWYFSGNYPTPGGNKVVNRAFINYVLNSNERAY